jgi:hypothetical protein
MLARTRIADGLFPDLFPAANLAVDLALGCSGPRQPAYLRQVTD